MNEVKALALPISRPKCAEHCYAFSLNPIQHPQLDANVHHLFALMTALCNTCGGVIFLTAPAKISSDEINFNRLTERLGQMLRLLGFPEGLVKTYECDTAFWGVIVAKKSHDKLPYSIGGNVVRFHIDVHRQIQCEFKNVIANKEPNMSFDARLNTPVVNENVDDASLFNPPPWVGFSELIWDQNKSNWQEILEPANQSLDSWVASCNIWRPSCPMRVTPDKESLKYLFHSDAECTEVIEHVKTEMPGFAIASRSCFSFLPEVDVEARPNSHVCDILTVSKQNDVCLWVIVSDSDEQLIPSQLQYMLTLGRTIKHHILSQNNNAPNLTIYCKLYSTQRPINDFIEKHTGYGAVQRTQELFYPKFHESENFHALQHSIALLLLSKQTSVSNCIGEQMSLALSAKQVKTLVDRKKVTYISSPPGTGKTLCGISLYREYGKQGSVYICPTQPLIQYLRYNGCDAILVQTDKDLCSHIEHGTFANKKCVVIDESHHLQCTRESWKKLFMVLKKNRDMFLFVFADNEFQSFDKRNPHRVADWIYELSRTILGIIPRTEEFKEMYRNTKKVVSFLQHAVEDTHRMNVSYANHMDGDGIHCTVIKNVWRNVSDNGLVQYLRPLMIYPNSSVDTKYQVTDVAVLLDGGYTDDEVCVIHRILRTQLPGITTHGSDKFPRDGIVVDRIDSFIGLDAGVCIFILSSMGEDRIIGDPRYRVFLASRATHRAVFALSSIDTAIAESMKFDRFHVHDISMVSILLNNI